MTFLKISTEEEPHHECPDLGHVKMSGIDPRPSGTALGTESSGKVICHICK